MHLGDKAEIHAARARYDRTHCTSMFVKNGYELAITSINSQPLCTAWMDQFECSKL